MEISREIEDIFTRYPALIDQISSITVPPIGSRNYIYFERSRTTGAFTDFERGAKAKIYLSPSGSGLEDRRRFINSLQRSLEEAEAHGRLRPSAMEQPRDIIRHEMGHVIERWLQQFPMSDERTGPIANLYQAIRAQAERDPISQYGVMAWGRAAAGR